MTFNFGDNGHKKGDNSRKKGDNGHKKGDNSRKKGDNGHKKGDNSRKKGDNGHKKGDNGIRQQCKTMLPNNIPKQYYKTMQQDN